MAGPDARAPYVDVRPFFDAVLRANPAHVLWATDWPHSAIQVPTPDDAELAQMTLSWMEPDDALRQQIFVQNPTAIYGFP